MTTEESKLARFLTFVKECIHIRYDEDGDEIEWDYNDGGIIKEFLIHDEFVSQLAEKDKEIESLKKQILQYELTSPFNGVKVKH
jgi:hypothetical protein